MPLETFGHVLIGLAVVLDGVAALIYFLAGDVARAVYWFGAGIATFVTVFIR